MSASEGARRAERRTYRRRRLADLARLLPFLALGLFALPLLWPHDPAGGAVPTSGVLVYVFLIWVVLAAISGFVSAHLSVDEEIRTRPMSPFGPQEQAAEAETGEPAADMRAQ